MRIRSFFLPLVAVLVTAAGACAPAAGTGPGASGTPSTADPEGQVQVEVRNTVVPPTQLTVYAVESPGTQRRMLGSVSANSTGTFSFRPVSGAGNYRIVARTLGGRELASTPFTVGLGQTVVWDVQTNAVIVQ
jgi:hypothetical protein